MDHSRAASGSKRTDAEQQYIHLVRLAWDLRWLGLETRVELPLSKEPRVVVPRAAGPLRVIATLRAELWIYSWGRGHTQWIDALAGDAARDIHKAAVR